MRFSHVVEIFDRCFGGLGLMTGILRDSKPTSRSITFNTQKVQKKGDSNYGTLGYGRKGRPLICGNLPELRKFQEQAAFTVAFEL